MTAQDALTLAFVILVAGAVLSGIASRARALAGAIAFAATAASGGLVLFVAGRVLLGTPSEPFTLLQWPALGSSLRIHVDGLSALFLVLIAGIALLASFYSIGYMRHYKDLGVGRYYPHFLLFVTGMYGIVTVTDLMGFFFLFWQLMTIPSFFLVRFEHRKAENVRAATRYLVMMEISCLLVMAAAWVLGGQNGSAAGGLATYDFERIAEGMPELLRNHESLVSLALLLFLAGFGIKAGMWPFGQLWLPDAHPAAPSPVSALLSGVMIKTGIYGLARSFLWLVPASALDSFPAKPGDS